MIPNRSFASAVLGAAMGCAAWAAFAAVQASLPVWLRFVIAAGVLTFGPGAVVACGLLAPLTGLARVTLSLALGLAFAPMLAHLLGATHALAMYPYLCALMTGGVLGYWRSHPRVRTERTTASWAVLVAAVMLAMGTMAFANRMVVDRGEIVLRGEYDSYDLTYYAEIAAELSHDVPPASPFFSGRLLNHSFYPHVVLAMVHRFGGVPILDLYFRFAWPAFLVLAALCCFVFLDAIAPSWAACAGALLFGTGSNLAYLAAWFLHPAVWDEVVWSHNFQGAGAEVLLYGNWTPALAVMFAALYAANAALTSRPAWAVLAGAAFASTVLSKPWIFASVVSALAVVAVTSWRDKALVRRLALMGAVSVAVAAPFLYRAVTLYDDAQVTFEPAFFPIPLVMADRIGLRDWLLARAGTITSSPSSQLALAAVLALPLFLAGTLGSRVVGVPGLWRALRRPADDAPIWRLLAWTAVAAFVAASFIVSVPYHESQQIHQFALFLMALFTARALTGIQGAGRRLAAAVAVIAVAAPGPLQYVHRKWTDREHVVAQASRGETGVLPMLRGTDPESTVLLHDRPGDPTLVGILAERRSVLSWAGYVRGSEERREDVERFFGGADAAAAFETLRKYRPTHVLEYAARDRIDPAVLDRLELVGRSGDVTLYRVPRDLR